MTGVQTCALPILYVAGYAVGRFWVESLRIDPASSGGGWRLNQWTALIAFVASVGFLAVDHLRHRGVEAADEVPPPESALLDEPALDDNDE